MIPQIRRNPVTLTAEWAEWAQPSLALAFFEPDQHPRDIARNGNTHGDATTVRLVSPQL